MENIKTNGKKVKYLAALILILLIAVALIFGFIASRMLDISGILPAIKYLAVKKNANQEAIDKEATLNLKYGQKNRWFKGEVTDNMAALNVLQTASIAGNFKLEASSTIVSLDGFVNDSQKKWTCYLNGEAINDPLSKKIIHAQDKIACQYK